MRNKSSSDTAGALLSVIVASRSGICGGGVVGPCEEFPCVKVSEALLHLPPKAPHHRKQNNERDSSPSLCLVGQPTSCGGSLIRLCVKDKDPPPSASPLPLIIGRVVACHSGASADLSELM